MEVSIILPVYNSEEYLSETIDSILCQTHENFVLIITDDGSVDRSVEIIKKYMLEDERVILIEKEHTGFADSLNTAIKHATTDWVFRIDADDIMLPNRLEKQIEFIQSNNKLKVCSSLAYYINEKGKIFGKTSHNLFDKKKFNWYLKNNETIGILHPGSALHRKTVLDIGGYRGRFFPAEDIDLWNRLSEKGHLILVQNEILMKYRVHSSSWVTSNFLASRMKYEWVRACIAARRNMLIEPTWDEFINEWNNYPFWAKINRWRKINAKQFYRMAGADRLNGRIIVALFEMGLAVILQPAYTIPRLSSQLQGKKSL